MTRPLRLLLLVGLLVVPRLASAHATLVRSTPTANTRLAAAPTRISLTFSEQVETGMTHVMLVTSAGRTIPLEVRGDPHDVATITAPIDESLPAGAYRVDWHLVSADGHPVQGSFVFGIGAATLPAHVAEPAGAGPPATLTWGPTAAEAPLVPALLRGLALGALMALGGLLYFRTTATTERASRAGNLTMTVLAVAAPMLLAMHLAAWAMNASPAHALTSETIGSAAGSAPGRVELLRLGLAVLALWALVIVRRPRWTMVFVVLATIASGATGHSAAMHPLVAVPFKAAHLLAGSLWIGGLVWLLTRAHDDASAGEREALRVSAAALLALVLVVVSGALQGLLFLATPLDVVRTAYGWVLLAKVAGVAVLAAFGAHHRYRVLPRLASQAGIPAAFRATLRLELVVMALVTLLGGLLAYLPPSPVHAAASPIVSSHSL